MVPVLFSVSYAGLWGQCRLELPAFIEKAKVLGFGAVELMAKRPHLSPLDFGDRELDDLRRAAERAGIEIATIAGYTDFTLGSGTETPAVEMQIAYVQRLYGGSSAGSARADLTDTSLTKCVRRCVVAAAKRTWTRPPSRALCSCAS